MLASGGSDYTIKLWDLSRYTIVQTLTGHEHLIRSMAIHKKYGKVILISGSIDNTIKVWDLDSYSVITTLEVHGGCAIILSVYNDDERPYLADHDSLWQTRYDELIAFKQHHSH